MSPSGGPEGLWPALCGHHAVSEKIVRIAVALIAVTVFQTYSDTSKVVSAVRGFNAAYELLIVTIVGLEVEGSQGERS